MQALPSMLREIADANKHSLKAMLGRHSMRHRPSRKDTATDVSRAAAGPDRPAFECVATLAEAYERALLPFEALKGILHPNLKEADSRLADAVLPFLLGNAASVDACFWYISPAQDVSVAQHVSQHYAQLRKLCKVATVFPVMAEDLVAADVDAASQLVQGDLRLWGVGKAGRVDVLRKRASVLRVHPHQREDTQITQALRLADLRSRSMELYRKWSVQVNRPLSMPSKSQHSRTNSEASESKDGRAGIGSQADGSSSSISNPAIAMPSSQTIAQRWISDAVEAEHSGCRSPHLDPLHARSLLRLVGLQMTDTFAAVRTCWTRFWQAGLTAESAAERRNSSVEEGKVQAEAANGLASEAGIRQASWPRCNLVPRIRHRFCWTLLALGLAVLTL